MSDKKTGIEAMVMKERKKTSYQSGAGCRARDNLVRIDKRVGSTDDH